MRNIVRFFLLLTCFTSKGFTMQPYRPELIKYFSPEKKFEIHAPKREKAKLVKKNGLLKPDTTFAWGVRIHPKYIFSDTSNEKIVIVGGLGDSGTELGKIYINTQDGKSNTIDLAKNIENLEELSQDYGKMGNFPWITAIDIDSEKNQLKIWVCAHVVALISLNTGEVETKIVSGTPKWAHLGSSTKSGPKVFFTDTAKKYLWERKDID